MSKLRKVNSNLRVQCGEKEICDEILSTLRKSIFNKGLWSSNTRDKLTKSYIFDYFTGFLYNFEIRSKPLLFSSRYIYILRNLHIDFKLCRACLNRVLFDLMSKINLARLVLILHCDASCHYFLFIMIFSLQELKNLLLLSRRV